MTAAPPPINPSTIARRGFRSRSLFWFGCALTLLGAGAVAAPQFGNILIGAAAGWLLWLTGALTLGGVLLMHTGASLWIGVLSSLFAVAAGVFLLTHPTIGAYATALLITSAFLVDGAFQLAFAIGLRPLKVWRWVLTSALASLVAAGVVGASLATDWTSALSLFVGVAVVTTGTAFIALSAARIRPG